MKTSATGGMPDWAAIATNADVEFDASGSEHSKKVELTQLSRGSWQSYRGMSKLASTPLREYANVAKTERKTAVNFTVLPIRDMSDVFRCASSFSFLRGHRASRADAATISTPT
jgi:hypothetical protein